MSAIVATSLVAVALEACGHFDSLGALLPGLMMGAYVTKIRLGAVATKAKISRTEAALFLGLLIIHLGFRLPTYSHIEGGQDQGLYHALGTVYEREGSDLFEDRLGAKIARLTPSEHARTVADLYQAGGGFEVPGAYPVANQPHHYRVEFYPLHPIWMAIVGRLIGLDFRTSSLTLFSVLGLIAAWRLVMIITGGDRRAAAFAGLLISTHPALAFAAKMPYSETAAFAFACTAGFYLVRTIGPSGEDAGGELLDASLALGCFACCALTRPNSIAYLPVLALGLLASMLFFSGSRRRPASATLAGMIVIIPASMAYFVFAMPTILGRHVDRISPSFLSSVGLLSLSLLVLGSGWWRSESRREAARVWLAKRFSLAVALSVVMLVGWQGWCLFSMLQSDLTHWLFYPRPAGIEELLRSAFGRTFVLLSPFGSALVGLSVVSPRVFLCGARGWLALLVVTAFPVLYWIGFRYSAYSFYYDRYLLSEVLPFTLILVAMVAAKATREHTRPSRHIVGWSCIVAALFWFTAASMAQIGHREGPAKELYGRIERVTDSDTLVVLETDSLWHFQAAITALRLELDLDVFPIRSAEQLSDSRTRQLFTLSDRAVVVAGRKLPHLELLDTIPHRRSFFHDNSKHMTELLADNRPSTTRTDRQWTPDWLAPALPPVAHSVLEFPVYIYRLHPGNSASTSNSTRGTFSDNGSGVVVFEAERQLTTASSPETLTVAEPASTTSAGQARRLELRDFHSAPLKAAVYGQYFPLQEGCYEVEFRLKIDQHASGPVALLDVAIERGAHQLDIVSLEVDDFEDRDKYQSFYSMVALEHAVDDAEFRVWYRGSSTVWVDFTRVRSLAANQCSPP